MTSTEATNLKAALSSLAGLFGNSASIQAYINRWKVDVDGDSNGLPNTGESVTGEVPAVLSVSTVANLPGTPSTNVEAIVTDASALTNGSTVAGGGSNRVLVRYDGANWKIV